MICKMSRKNILLIFSAVLEYKFMNCEPNYLLFSSFSAIFYLTYTYMEYTYIYTPVLQGRPQVAENLR